VPHFACEPQGLDPGTRIQAAADIAFKPAGLVEEGALGRVVVDGPVDATRPEQDVAPAERVVVVSWEGIPGLKGSRVTRDMVIQAIVAGDRVEALIETVYQAADPQAAPPATLAVADLVRATRDLGGVKRGTFGTVVAGPGDKESWRVSDDERVVVSFTGQLATMKVLQTHVKKAPQVGELVQALVNVHGEGTDIISQGTVGAVTDVQTGDNGGEFGFVVDWRDHTTSMMKEDQLEVLNGAQGAIVPRGTRGKVMTVKASSEKSVAKATFVVDWDGFEGPGALVQRRHVSEVADWSPEKAAWCCREQDIGCEKTDGTVTHYRCDRGDPQAWLQEKKDWCCKHKEQGCSHAEGGEPSAPLPTPRIFDPAPHTGVTTVKPGVRK